MLEQILTQAVSHVQQITAILIFAAVVLELIHIGQTRRINKKLSYAGGWLQRYLRAVFNEEAQEYTDEDEETHTAVADRAEAAQLQVSQALKSRQEDDMRVSLARRKLKKDEELLDSVLEEIFD